MDTDFLIEINQTKYSIEIEYLRQIHFFKQSDRLHIHPAYHFILISEGSNDLYLRNTPPQHTETNSLIFINPLVPHHFSPDPKTGVEHTCIVWRFKDTKGNYELTPLQEILGISNCNRDYIVKKINDIDAKSFIAKERRAGMAYENSDSVLASMFMWQLCFYGIDLLWSDAITGDQPKYSMSEKLTQKIKNLIDPSISDSALDIPAIANELSLHPNYINKIFRLVEGIPIGRYIINKRLELAKMLLTNTDLNICEIAEACGFNQHSYFTRTFKKTFTQNPLEYRNEHNTV